MHIPEVGDVGSAQDAEPPSILLTAPFARQLAQGISFGLKLPLSLPAKAYRQGYLAVRHRARGDRQPKFCVARRCFVWGQASYWALPLRAQPLRPLSEFWFATSTSPARFDHENGVDHAFRYRLLCRTTRSNTTHKTPAFSSSCELDGANG